MKHSAPILFYKMFERARSLAAIFAFILCQFLQFMHMISDIKVFIRNIYKIKNIMKIMRNKIVQILLELKECMKVSTCLYLPVFNYLSLSTCFYLPVFIHLSLSTCLYLPVFIYLSLTTCLYLPVFIHLSLSTCL